MLLAIDAGNTNTVFAVYKGDKLLDLWRCEASATRGADEYAVFLNNLCDLAKIKLTNIEDVIISSVVPEANFHLRRFCQKYLNCTPMLVDDKMVNIPIDLERPEEIGADRLVNAVAVIQHYRTPAVAIDFGTATTFDVIDAKGHYRGGAIAPGVNLSIDALHRGSAKLPRISVGKPDNVIGTSTVQAIRSGIYWGYTGLIEGILERIEEELGAKPFVLATGGLAPLFARDIPAIQAVDEELTLKGLLYIYKQQQQSGKKRAHG
jgi:type III pantothenate kinase